MTCPACGSSRPHHLMQCRRGRDAMWALVTIQTRNTFRAPVAQRWARSYLDWTRT